MVMKQRRATPEEDDVVSTCVMFSIATRSAGGAVSVGHGSVIVTTGGREEDPLTALLLHRVGERSYTTRVHGCHPVGVFDATFSSPGMPGTSNIDCLTSGLLP